MRVADEPRRRGDLPGHPTAGSAMSIAAGSSYRFAHDFRPCNIISGAKDMRKLRVDSRFSKLGRYYRRADRVGVTCQVTRLREVQCLLLQARHIASLMTFALAIL